MVLAGSPMFTMLKMLKKSERNCTSKSSPPLERLPTGVSLMSEKSKS
jgi:hypothetical protein